ncbi:hypothetical protein BHE74_00042162 [Ensete ventricosum]|nr:hypothetical protein GW17_00048374 [Ensete ventricosum]RWW51485.1 hypothetical protein BHE74_00042162 [Ensete ventricosum]
MHAKGVSISMAPDLPLQSERSKMSDVPSSGISIPTTLSCPYGDKHTKMCDMPSSVGECLNDTKRSYESKRKKMPKVFSGGEYLNSIIELIWDEHPKMLDVLSFAMLDAR